MALYVPAGRRRRNLALGLAGALIVGLVIGVAIGRVTAPTVDDRVGAVQDDARAVTGTLAATPNEYAKQLAGSSEFRRGGGVDQALTSARHDLDAALDDASWLGPSQRATATGALDAVVAAERDRVAEARYQQAVDAAVATISRTFGIDEPPS